MSQRLTVIDSAALSTPIQVGPEILSYHPDTGSKIYRRTFHAYAANRPAPDYTATGVITHSAVNAYLVETSPPRIAGPGVIEWENVYAEIPGARVRGESFVYTYPVYSGQVVNWSIASNSIVRTTYLYTTTPETIALSRPEQLFSTGDGNYAYLSQEIVNTGGINDTPPSGYIIAETTQIERWFPSGNLWVRRNRFVPNLSAIFAAWVP